MDSMETHRIAVTPFVSIRELFHTSPCSTNLSFHVKPAKNITITFRRRESGEGETEMDFKFIMLLVANEDCIYKASIEF